MSFIVRFICCGATKTVKEEDEKPEDNTGYNSPRFGHQNSNDISPPSKSQDQTKNVSNFTTFNNVVPQSENGETQQEQQPRRKTSESRIAALAREKNLTLNTARGESKAKANSELIHQVHNISVMSIAAAGEENNEGGNETGTFHHKSEEDPSIVLNKMKSDPSINNSTEKPKAVLKGGMAMRKLDRNRESVSPGLSTENIFQDKKLSKKQTGKREVLNSTPIMKSSTVSSIKQV